MAIASDFKRAIGLVKKSVFNEFNETSPEDDIYIAHRHDAPHEERFDKQHISKHYSDPEQDLADEERDMAGKDLENAPGYHTESFNVDPVYFSEKEAYDYSAATHNAGEPDHRIGEPVKALDGWLVELVGEHGKRGGSRYEDAVGNIFDEDQINWEFGDDIPEDFEDEYYVPSDEENRTEGAEGPFFDRKSFKGAINILKKGQYSDPEQQDLAQLVRAQEADKERDMAKDLKPTMWTQWTPIYFDSAYEAGKFSEEKLGNYGTPFVTGHGWLLDMPDGNVIDAAKKTWSNDELYAVDPNMFESLNQISEDFEDEPMTQASFKGAINILKKGQSGANLPPPKDNEKINYNYRWNPKYESVGNQGNGAPGVNLIPAKEDKGPIATQNPPPDEDDFDYFKPQPKIPTTHPKQQPTKPAPQPQPKMTSYPGDPLDGSLPGLNVPTDIRSAFKSSIGLVKSGQALTEKQQIDYFKNFLGTVNDLVGDLQGVVNMGSAGLQVGKGPVRKQVANLVIDKLQPSQYMTMLITWAREVYKIS